MPIFEEVFIYHWHSAWAWPVQYFLRKHHLLHFPKRFHVKPYLTIILVIQIDSNNSTVSSYHPQCPFFFHLYNEFWEELVVAIPQKSMICASVILQRVPSKLHLAYITHLVYEERILKWYFANKSVNFTASRNIYFS